MDERLKGMVGDMGCNEGDIINAPQNGQATVGGSINVNVVNNNQAGGEPAKCSMCEARNELRDTFECRQCKRDFPCRSHQEPEHFICIDCARKKEQAMESKSSLADEKVKVCLLCGRRNRLLETFQCRQCGKDFLCLSHLDKEYSRCNKCADNKRAELKLNQMVSEVRADIASGDLDGAESKLQGLRSFFRQYRDNFSDDNLLLELENALRIASRKPRPGRDWTDPFTNMKFVWVAGGAFHMGDIFGDGYDNEKPVHKVFVDGFWIGRYPVTQGEWEKVMGHNPSFFKKGANYPVEQVSQEDVREFIEKLNNRVGLSYRLPTEAEWEYAARSGGKKERYAGGNNVGLVAWYGEDWENGSTHPVGIKQANGLGIHDMSGNVWEWCSDWYHKKYYSRSPRDNPKGFATGSSHVLRGGSWNCSPVLVRASSRGWRGPACRIAYIGFRLCLS